jgi:HK97 family phage major capsid protein
MQINYVELGRATERLAFLANKPGRLNDQERREFGSLPTRIAAIKVGATIEEINEQELNDAEARNGLPITRLRKKRSAEDRARGAMFQQMFSGNAGGRAFAHGIEYRAGEQEGNISAQVGTYTGLGYFVPQDLVREIWAAMAEVDVLFDVDGPCTVKEKTNARTLKVTVYNDTSINTTQGPAEGNPDGSVTLLQLPSYLPVGAYTFRTPLHPVSIEATQDIEEMIEFADLFKKFSTERLARAIGKMLVTGNGVGQTQGLISSLEASGVTPITAAGSTVNDGSGSPQSTIGSQDISNLVFSVNEVYRNSPSAGFLMSSSTLSKIAGVLDKQGQMLRLVQYIGGKPYMLGYPIHICPSLPSPATSVAAPVVFGDLSYWHTFIVSDAQTKIQTLKEAPGLIENGNYGVRMFVRAGGAYAYNGGGSNAPLNYIVMHS